MSTSREIQRIRKTEQRFPADLIHNGHSYERGYAVPSETINKLREIRRIARQHGVGVTDALGA